MALEISKTFVVNAAPEAVWSFLIDLPRVARCLPGAAIGEKLDEKTSTGTMTIKVGPVSSTYRGKGGADLRLTSSLKALPGGQTEVTAVSLVNVTGILAQMGRGMIQDVSDEMFQIFSERMRAELESSGAVTAPPSAAVTDGRPAVGVPPGAGQSGPNGASSLASSSAPSVGATAQPEALDAAALGARVARRSAGRLARQPVFWAVLVLLVAGVAYLLLHRSSSGP